VNGISEPFKKIAKKHNFNLAFSINNSLNKFIRTGKDTISTLSYVEVVYKISVISDHRLYNHDFDWERILRTYFGHETVLV